MKYISLSVALFLVSHLIKAQEYASILQTESQTINDSKNRVDSNLGFYSSVTEPFENESVKFFIAYELGEALFNKFQSLSGEIGVRFKNQQLLRLVHVNLNLTEKHLSSGFAGAVDGENVEGKQFGFESFYDFPAIFNGLTLGPSIGYYKSEYQHTILNERIENSSFSLGASVSYRDTNIFKIKGLYYSFSLPMRINLNPIEETKLGDAVVANSTFDNNIWLFIGYEF